MAGESNNPYFTSSISGSKPYTGFPRATSPATIWRARVFQRSLSVNRLGIIYIIWRPVHSPGYGEIISMPISFH